MKDIKLTPIKNGTAIDHLHAGSAYKILQIMGIQKHTVTIGMNVESTKMGKKDLIFVEGKEISEKELNKIAIIGHGATINIINDSKITKKFKLAPPEYIEGLVKCANKRCITNAERLGTKFDVNLNKMEGRCRYCEQKMNEIEMLESIT
jgi:aspartate carbamoyltransferase regulatory subunit